MIQTHWGDNMRHKMGINEKRSNQIGIKVQIETKEQLNYIAGREGSTLSTLINNILKDYINSYFKIAKIDWKKIPPEERGGK